MSTQTDVSADQVLVRPGCADDQSSSEEESRIQVRPTQHWRRFGTFLKFSIRVIICNALASPWVNHTAVADELSSWKGFLWNGSAGPACPTHPACPHCEQRRGPELENDLAPPNNVSEIRVDRLMSQLARRNVGLRRLQPVRREVLEEQPPQTLRETSEAPVTFPASLMPEPSQLNVMLSGAVTTLVFIMRKFA